MNARLPANLCERLDRAAADAEPDIVRFRRTLHANPEASGEERDTSVRIAEALGDIGIEPYILRDGIGVVANLDLGGPPESFIALRADIDCVRVPDEKDVDYRSRCDGLCHACGHDAHSAILLGVARMFTAARETLLAGERTHNLRLIFQPAEESAVGATSMIEQGAIDAVRGIFALHVDPFLEPGSIGVRNGCLTAGAERFTVTVRGTGGHSARPNEAHDPIAAATLLVQQFYVLGPRSFDARQPAVLNVSTIEGGDAFNAIPDECTMSGTLRAISHTSADHAREAMKAAAQGVSAATGCAIDLRFDRHCPPTANDPELNALLAEAAADALGPPAVHHLPVPSMGAEDFAFYQERISGAMFRLGTALPGEQRQPLHSSRFDIDERAMQHGMRILARAAALAVSRGLS